jgi:hypothetical protein
LGLSSESGIKMLYARHQDEFTSDETRVISFQTAGGLQDIRVFSLRGTRLLTLFARTQQAKLFRKWVLDLLDGKVRLRAPALPRAVSTDARHALRTVAEWPDMPEPVRARLLEVAETGVGVARFPELTALAEKRLEASLGAAPFMAAINEIDRRGAAMGISKDALKTEMQLLKRLREQPELDLSTSDQADA